MAAGRFQITKEESRVTNNRSLSKHWKKMRLALINGDKGFEIL